MPIIPLIDLIGVIRQTSDRLMPARGASHQPEQRFLSGEVPAAIAGAQAVRMPFASQFFFKQAFHPIAGFLGQCRSR